MNDFEIYVTERLEQAQHDIEITQEYREHLQEVNAKYAQLIKTFNEEQKELMTEYCVADSTLEAIIQENLYRTGHNDGIALFKGEVA